MTMVGFKHVRWHATTFPAVLNSLSEILNVNVINKKKINNKKIYIYIYLFIAPLCDTDIAYTFIAMAIFFRYIVQPYLK